MIRGLVYLALVLLVHFLLRFSAPVEVAILVLLYGVVFKLPAVFYMIQLMVDD
jgi:hypothetical protein